jgi:hypothetical protein
MIDGQIAGNNGQKLGLAVCWSDWQDLFIGGFSTGQSHDDRSGL